MEHKLRGNFYTGNYKAMLEHTPSDQAAPQVTSLQMRALAQLGQVQGTSSKSIELLSVYLSKSQSPEKVLAQLPADDPLSETLTAIIYMNEGDSSQVIDNLKPKSEEHIGLLVCAFLKIRRPDLAESLTKEAGKNLEDEVVLDLATAWVSIFKGEYEEANSYVTELISNYGESSCLLNLLGICALEDGNYPEAEHLFEKALSLAREAQLDTDVANSLKNGIALKRQLQQDVSAYEEQLRETCPDHEYFTTMEKASQLFDQLIS